MVDTGKEFLNHPGAVPLNVFVYAFRATSKNAFIRQMPNSWDFISRNLELGRDGGGSGGGFLFDGYNAVDFGAKDSLGALLSGDFP